MERFAYSATVLSFFALVILQLCGMDSKSAKGIWNVVSLGFMGVLLVGIMATLWRMVFVNARPVEAKNVNEAALPERVFGYRGQKGVSLFMMLLGGFLASPLLVFWPYLLVFEPWLADSAMFPVLGGLMFLMAVVMFVVGWRYWYARVTVYPDRLDVRGIFSNGSMTWNEATEFIHKELPNTNDNTMWVYFLCNETRNIRVESTLRNPEAFVQLVQSKTGLKLERCSMNGEPETVALQHEAFRK